MQLSGKVDLFGNAASRLKANTEPAFILVSVIIMEVAKTVASFLAIC